MNGVLRKNAYEMSPESRKRTGLYTSLFLIGLLVVTSIPLHAQRRGDSPFREASETDLNTPRRTFRLKDLELHPDLLYQPYLSGTALGNADSRTNRIINDFRELLALYIQRQGTDDNFSIRVIDNRNGRTLELQELDAERRNYEREGKANWGTIDIRRRAETRRLMDKWENRGFPRDALSVRWGRSNEVWEARQHELPFIEYEIQLARYLGLSLLATEIGTVETFNLDRKVSPAGARSRYQMMPYTLKQNGIRRYTLKTASGGNVTVAEEWHPLLTMESAFVTLKGYANAAGHEIPGISSYHAGPGNIFKIYERYLEQPDRLIKTSPTVLDAYVWGLTEGFTAVSNNSSFGTYSRTYVPAVYGSLKAMEDESIDTTLTLLAERVQLKTGRNIYLSRLLDALDRQESRLNWGHLEWLSSVYSRFKEMNPHFELPVVNGPGVPVRGDVRLVSEVKGTPVRFFLPLGATKALRQAGVDILDEDKTFTFDHATYRSTGHAHETRWDRQYQDLVDDIGRFGFTNANRDRLGTLKEKFRELNAANPSHYRRLQLRIIEAHDRLWNSAQFDRLAATTSENRSKIR